MSNEFFSPDNNVEPVPQTPVNPEPVKKSPGKGILIALILGVLILVVVGIFAFLLKSEDQKTSDTTKTIEAVKVLITRDGFVPANLSVKTGSQVVWTNNDKVKHSLSIQQGTDTKTINTYTLAPKESFSLVVGDASIYHFDSPAGGKQFKGLIIVSNKESK